jgi:hypothetical protein
MVQEVLRKEISLEKDKKVWIFDNIFDLAKRTELYTYAISSLFKIDGSDNGLLEFKDHLSMVSVYNETDVHRMGIFNFIPQNIKEEFNINLDTMSHAMINLCTPSDRFHTHVDNYGKGLTMVYYLNMNWNPEWGGDTLFLNESGEEIQYLSQFKPGRLVLFDSSIPHLIRPSTVLAPHFRFSFAAKFISVT